MGIDYIGITHMGNSVYGNSSHEIVHMKINHIKINIGVEVDYIEGYESETKCLLNKYGE